MSNTICDYSNLRQGINRPHLPMWHTRGPHIHPGGDHYGDAPKAPRKRVTCPKCGRRLWAAIRTNQDGCTIYYCIPRHKVKEWWKKESVKKTTRKRSRKRGRRDR